MSMPIPLVVFSCSKGIEILKYGVPEPLGSCYSVSLPYFNAMFTPACFRMAGKPDWSQRLLCSASERISSYSGGDLRWAPQAIVDIVHAQVMNNGDNILGMSYGKVMIDFEKRSVTPDYQIQSGTLHHSRPNVAWCIRGGSKGPLSAISSERRFDSPRSTADEGKLMCLSYGEIPSP